MRWLKPNGVLGVVDFYYSQPLPAAGLARHGALTRLFWRRWFAHDGVRLNPEHLDALRALMRQHDLVECCAAVPCMPLLRVPYYILIGKKS